MKKSLLISISRNNTLVNLYASLGIISLLGLVSFPFMGLSLLAFLCAVLAPLFVVLMSGAEKDLYTDLKQAKFQLGLSMFTNEKQLLEKCLKVYKSI